MRFAALSTSDFSAFKNVCANM